MPVRCFLMHCLTYRHINPDILFQVINMKILRNGIPVGYILLILITALIAGDRFYFQNRLYPGIYLHQVPLGGSTLASLESSIPDLEIILSGSEGKTAVYTVGELGIRPDIPRLFSASYLQARSRSVPFAYLDRFRLNRNGISYPLYFDVDEEAFAHAVTVIADQFSREPKDAAFHIADDGTRIEIEPEEAGIQINSDELARQLHGLFATPDKPLFLVVPETLVPARVTAAALEGMGITEPIGSFSTLFHGSAEDRVHNIRLAVSQIDNLLIAPGETFSLNNILGDSTPEKGYRKAPIIVGDRLVAGYGGGLCQVSTTLYNAALLAGLDIVERHHHNMAVPYVPPGRDATISYGARDMRFRNSSGHYILVNGIVGSNELTFRLFGTGSDERIVIETEILDMRPYPVQEITDPSLPPGQEEITDGEFGYLVSVWKTVYLDDEIVSRTQIHLDDYQPFPAVIKRGAPADS